MRPGDTICAIASAPGHSQLGIVRVSGADTLELIHEIIGGGVSPPNTPGAHKSVLRIAHDTHLPVGIILYRAPRSYTGEDACEIIAPGSPIVLERVTAAMVASGLARHAEPGEFTARAHAAGKLTLSQAEGVSATIAAESEDALRAARDLLTGARGDAASTIVDELSHLLALVEAGIDFADEEDVVPIEATDLRARLAALAPRLRSWIAQGAHLTARSGVPAVVLVGAPNAGKSTLFNALLGHTRVVASPVAGTTVDRIAEELVLDERLGSGGRVLLTDTPGIEGNGANTPHAADLVLVCDPLGVFEHAGQLPGDVPTLLVRTKADRPPQDVAETSHAREKTPKERALHTPARTRGSSRDSDSPIQVCALTGAGLDELKRAIADATPGLRPSGTAAALARHADAYAEAAHYLDAAREHTMQDDRAISEPEMVAHALRTALDRLGEVSGRVATDDLLGRIFRSFCIGK